MQCVCTRQPRSAKENIPARQAVDAADYIGRIQQFADNVAAANRSLAGPAVLTVDEILSEPEADWEESQLAQLAGPAAVDTWSVDITTVDIRQEQEVQVEIEDIVSQLNFAAFSMEAFSVEQISIEPCDQHPQPPRDSIRSGQSDEIYTMHRPNSMPKSEQIGTDFLLQAADDDRDLLVIEEDLPQACSAADESQQPITKIAPYSQLFAKLRK